MFGVGLSYVFCKERECVVFEDRSSETSRDPLNGGRSETFKTE